MPSKRPYLKSFKANQHGRDFIVGDVHGHFEMLQSLLKTVDFTPAQDRLFVTGDIVDRGPYSNEALDWLANPWFQSVRGNHEQMVLDSVNGQGDPPRHTRNGGAWFYEHSNQRQLEIAQQLQGLPIAIEIELRTGEKVGIIHAELPGWEQARTWREGIELLEAADPATRQAALMQALYARSRINDRDDSPIAGLARLYVGHSTVPEVLTLGNVVYLDTGCSFADGKLSIIEAASNTCWSCLPHP
ncbi:metallophosphoesterase [Pseudomonas plecoglossicida]|uniref:metallophosphoesterase n=1 Tax=Pseudomonas plecoglossicida TaxID=70775 RepID=UPI0015E2D2D1|nr:metallophosphoesterase [Pseudomonas plecoglossicida]MBA1321420.1 phosphoprotein phosphatase [Pseudomonas plecoglossicida]